MVAIETKDAQKEVVHFFPIGGLLFFLVGQSTMLNINKPWPYEGKQR